MNRRRFLSLLAGAGAASATSYFFAPIGGWKSDVIAQPKTLSYLIPPLGETWLFGSEGQVVAKLNGNHARNFHEKYATVHPCPWWSEQGAAAMLSDMALVIGTARNFVA